VGIAGRRAVRGLSRRQVLLLAIGALTLLATFPVVGHHALGGGALLDGRDNIGALCLVALHVILAPVHYGFHIALIVGFFYAVADRARAWARLNSGLGRLPLVRPPSTGPLGAAVKAAGVDPERVRVVENLANPAFTAGWWKPRIYLAAELPQLLSRPELERLVAHEGAHLDRRDPLRLAVLRFFACMLFWIPALRKLAADVADEAEFEADEVAAGGRPLVLASAILSVALWKKPGLATPAGVGAVSAEATVGTARPSSSSPKASSAARTAEPARRVPRAVSADIRLPSGLDDMGSASRKRLRRRDSRGRDVPVLCFMCAPRVGDRELWNGPMAGASEQLIGSSVRLSARKVHGA